MTEGAAEAEPPSDRTPPHHGGRPAPQPRSAMRSLLCIGALLLTAPLAHAQGVTVERDGHTVTITRPDGTTERFTMEEDAPLRVRSENGTVIVEEDDGARRRVEVHRGDAPRAFDGPRSSLRMALDLDSLTHELDGRRWLSRDALAW